MGLCLSTSLYHQCWIHLISSALGMEGLNPACKNLLAKLWTKHLNQLHFLCGKMPLPDQLKMVQTLVRLQLQDKGQAFHKGLNLDFPKDWDLPQHRAHLLLVLYFQGLLNLILSKH